METKKFEVTNYTNRRLRVSVTEKNGIFHVWIADELKYHTFELEEDVKQPGVLSGPVDVLSGPVDSSKTQVE